MRLAWIFPEVFISIRLVKAKIDGLRLAEEAQISCAMGGSLAESKDQLS